MRSSTNILIANVAFADFLMTIDIPYMLKWFYVLSKWLGKFMSTVLRKLLHCSLVGSLAVFSLVVISLDCNFAILFPMKRCAFRYRHDVVRCTDVMLSIMIATKNKQWEGKDGMICDELCNPISGRLCYSHFRYFLHRSTDSALIITSLWSTVWLVFVFAAETSLDIKIQQHAKKSKPLADKRL